MQLRNGIQTLDAYRLTFDPHLDIATVVFSHVQCVKTRVNLALVSKLWRDASKAPAAYPRTFDLDAFPDVGYRGPRFGTRSPLIISLLDNDEALSLPYERVVGFLGEAAEYVCDCAASLGSVRLLKWARENNRAKWDAFTCTSAAGKGYLPALKYLHENGCHWDEWTCSSAAEKGHLFVLQYLHENGCPWDRHTCYYAATKGHLPALQYLHENGCPWDYMTCLHAAFNKRWDCLQYAVDNKCPYWEWYAKHLR